MNRTRGAERARWRDESLEWLAIEAGAEAAEMLAWARRFLALEDPVDAAPLVRSLAHARRESVAAAAIDLAAARLSNANDPSAWLHRAAPSEPIGAIEAEIARMAKLGFPRARALKRIAERVAPSGASDPDPSAAIAFALALDGHGGRAELVRAAREIRMGRIGRARRALERLRRAGRSPAWRDAAAVGLSFCELALGRPDRALEIDALETGALETDLLATHAPQRFSPARTLLQWNRLVAAAELGVAEIVDAACDGLATAIPSRLATPSLAAHDALAAHGSLEGHIASRLRDLMARLESRRRGAWPILARLELFAASRGWSGFLGSSADSDAASSDAASSAPASAPTAPADLGFAAGSVVIPSAKPACARPG